MERPNQSLLGTVVLLSCLVLVCGQTNSGQRRPYGVKMCIELCRRTVGCSGYKLSASKLVCFIPDANWFHGEGIPTVPNRTCLGPAIIFQSKTRGRVCAAIAHCGAGWREVGGQCYLLGQMMLTAGKAQKMCEGFGGYLAKADSMADWHGIRSFRKETSCFWIGGTDEAKEGTWVWRDGSPVDPKLWKSRRPDNRGNEDCLALHYGVLNDLQCSSMVMWLCEK